MRCIIDFTEDFMPKKLQNVVTEISSVDLKLNFMIAEIDEHRYDFICSIDGINKVTEIDF